VHEPQAVLGALEVTPWLRDLVAAGAAASGLMLLTAGLSKVRDRQMFGSQIATYQLIPAPASAVLGHVLPFGEVLAGIAVFVVPRVGGASAAVLFAMFAIAVAVNLARGRTELVCGCFGPRGRHTISPWHVAGDVVLAVVGVVVSVSSAGPSVPAVVLGGSLLLVAAVAWSVREAWRPPRELIRMKEE